MISGLSPNVTGSDSKSIPGSDASLQELNAKSNMPTIQQLNLCTLYLQFGVLGFAVSRDSFAEGPGLHSRL
jgi:hypothetical protein